MNTAVIAAWPSRGRQLFPGVLARLVGSYGYRPGTQD